MPFLFTAVFWYELAISVVISVAVQVIQKALTPKQKPPRPEFDVEYNGTLEPRRFGFGTMRVSGMNTIPPWVTGQNGEFLWQVLTVSGVPIVGIRNVYFNNDDVGTINSDGSVAAPSIYAGKAIVRRYNGDQTTVDTLMNSKLGAWTSEFVGFGCAYIVLQYTYDATLYQGSKPEITCLADLCKVYDPRLDITPGANPTAANYQVFSTNPALCLGRVLLDTEVGLGELPIYIDWTLLMAAANICDEMVVIPVAPFTQKRYTANVIMNAPVSVKEFEDRIATLAEAMQGVCYWSGGLWRMYAGAWTVPEFEFDESYIIGPVEASTNMSRKSEGYYNYVRGSFVDPLQNYQQVEFKPVANAAYELQDGGERIAKDVVFDACTDQWEAQRNAIQISRMSRRQRSGTFPMDLRAFKVRPFYTGYMTCAEFGWVRQLVRCTGWRMKPDPIVELDLIEAGASDWNTPLATEYQLSTTQAQQVVDDQIPYNVSNIQVIPLRDGILVSYDLPAIVLPDTVFEFYISLNPDRSNQSILYRGGDSQFWIALPDTNPRYIWAKAVRHGKSSTFEPLSGGVQGGLLIGGSTDLQAYAQPSALTKTFAGSSSATSNLCTIIPSHGTAPYTYAWTRVSGDTRITCNSPSAVATTFSVTGVAIAEIVAARWQCVVTDSAGSPATFTVPENVNFQRISNTDHNNA